jgi:hypothetical protein
LNQQKPYKQAGVQPPPQRHYHQPVSPHGSDIIYHVMAGLFALMFFVLLIVGIVQAHAQVAQLSVYLFYVALAGALIILGYAVWHTWRMDKLKRKHAELDIQAKEQQMHSDKEAHAMQMYLAQTRLYPDVIGNKPSVFNPKTYEIVEASSGNVVQPVPHTYAPHQHYEYNDTSRRSIEEGHAHHLLTAGGWHIPTFAESMAAGDIGPHQQKLLFCHQLVRDENTKKVIEVVPERCELGDASTLLLSGQSKSGKTTYMANISLQQAFMHSLFFGIDPHRTHPEKSLTAKLEALVNAGYFVLPPAMSDVEVFHVMKAIQAECNARLHRKETRLSGYNIVVLVDEIVALMSRAQRTTNKETIQMYKEFGLLLRDIGTQFNKYGINGVFGTQYVTKEVLGEAEWRDACTGQGVLKLPANQAQALKLLHGDDLRAVPSLAPGHGFMVFGDESVPIRMASGDTTVADVEHVARILPPSPLKAGKVSVSAYVESTVEDVPPARNQPETAEKPPKNQARNQSHTALNLELEEKLQHVLTMEAQGYQKPEIMKEVWHVNPNGSERYNQTNEEYKLIKRTIAERMGAMES